MVDDAATPEGGATKPETARVTLIVTPRERFGVAIESLKSIVADTQPPFELIYIDAGSPKAVADEIQQICREQGYRYLRFEHFLSPNQSRNIGYRTATTPYVVYLDNDVVVSPGWLEALVDCADETEAEVVAPLTCQKLPLHTEIHQAGGRFADDVHAFLARAPEDRRIDEEHILQGKNVGDVTLERGPTQCCEFHCALVRREALERLGGLDEKLLATKEHIDFCLSVWKSGGKVMFEPRSIVTYLFPSRARPLNRQDWAFFTLRWSPQWQTASLDHFQAKWQLPEDPYFDQRARLLEFRHREGIVKPAVRQLPVVGNLSFAQRVGHSLMLRSLKLWAGRLAARHSRETAGLTTKAAPSPTGELAAT